MVLRWMRQECLSSEPFPSSAAVPAPASSAMGISIIRGVGWHSEDREGTSEGTGVRDNCQGVEKCALPFPVLGSSPEVADPPAAGSRVVATVKLK